MLFRSDVTILKKDEAHSRVFVKVADNKLFIHWIMAMGDNFKIIGPENLVKEVHDERRQAEEQERLQAQAKRDLDLTIKGLKLDVVDAVQEMGLDAGFRNLIAVEDLATITDEDERKAKLTERVKGMKKLFDAEVAKEVAKAKAEFLKGSTPATGSSSNKKDETKYDAYKKAGNVKGMLNEKLGAYRNKENEE